VCRQPSGLSGAGVQNDHRWHAAFTAGRDAGLEPEPDFAYPPNMEVNRVGNDSTYDYCQRPDLLRRIARLDVPMLAIAGSEDIRPVWPVLQIVNLMPNARFELLEGAGHDLWLTHADVLRMLLRRFLTSTQAATSVAVGVEL
jgi:proline iminopeptidase